MRRLTGLVLVWMAWASPALGHVSMLLPSTPATKKGEEVVFSYQWGHPFEHQLFDAPRPSKVVVLEPNSGETAPKLVDLTASLQKAEPSGADGKPVTVWQFRYTPAGRGDYVFLLTAAPVLLQEENYIVQDTVKVVLHVQAQQGWDAAVPDAQQLVPLTRPYGLQPYMVVQARLSEAKNADFFVEFERYNARAPKELPPDEQITRTARTDPNGVVTGTLTEPGWWALTARRTMANETLKLGDTTRPLHRRVILWVHVDPKPGAK